MFICAAARDKRLPRVEDRWKGCEWHHHHTLRRQRGEINEQQRGTWEPTRRLDDAQSLRRRLGLGLGLLHIPFHAIP